VSIPIGSLMDLATPYLTEVFGFIVITDVTYVSASSSAAALEEAIRVAEDELTLWI